MSEDAVADTKDLSLAQRGLRGAAWSYGGAVVVIGAQLAYTALTARLISPAEFGAYATAQALMSIVGYFTLATVGNALIRHPALDRSVIGTAIAITGAAGTLVALVVLAAADIWADIWRSPDAASLIRLFAPQAIFAGLAIAPLSLLRRDLRYRAATMIETSTALLGFTIGSALALNLRSPEALVAGQVATAAGLLALSVLTTRGQLALSYSRRHARELFSFSAQVSVQNLGHYLTNTLPSLAVSRSLGQASLGFYSRASLLVGLPLTFLAQGVTKTLYPIYPRFRTATREECRRMMVDVTSVTTTLVWPLFAALAGFGPLVVDLLLGPEWTPVISLIGPLCLYAGVNFAYAVVASYAEAFGYLGRIWVVQACWTAALLGALGVAVAADAGMRTIVLAAVGVHLAIHVFQLVLVSRAGTLELGGTLRVEAWALVVAAVWYIATMAVTDASASAGLAVKLGSSAAVAGLLAVATWLVFPRLPAGKALIRRGIRIPLTQRLFKTV